MEPDKVDLHLLDPARDELLWRRKIATLAARAWLHRQEHLSVTLQLLRWTRPALAMAVAAALVAMVGASWVEPRAATTIATEPVYQFAAWATTDQIPSTVTILETFGGHHVAE